MTSYLHALDPKLMHMADCTATMSCMLSPKKMTARLSLITFGCQASTPQAPARRSLQPYSVMAMNGLCWAHRGFCGLSQCSDERAQLGRPPGSDAAANAVKHGLLQPHNLHSHIT